MISRRATIYLIPGFFGFANLGGITYFHHVDEFLTHTLQALGYEVNIHYVKTSPTASIRRRTRLLYDSVAATAPDDDSPIHLIGHSTGGLDARMFTSPGVRLDDEEELEVERYAARVRSVVTVATPHRGTPLAFFFNSLLGSQLLFLLSLATIYALRFGRFPLSATFSMLGIVTRLDDRIGWQNTILDQFYDNLFREFDDEHLTTINAFLEDVRTDRALLGQLTPGAGDLFNAIAGDRPETRYGSVITQGRRPQMKSLMEVGLNPYRQGSHMIYRLIYLLTSFGPLYPGLKDEQEAMLREIYGTLPDQKDNDGVVPTWSQPWGEVIHAAHADHLDVCGHFTGPEHRPPHIDWLNSGTGFGREEFESLWGDVAAFVAAAHEGSAAPTRITATA